MKDSGGDRMFVTHFTLQRDLHIPGEAEGVQSGKTQGMSELSSPKRKTGFHTVEDGFEATATLTSCNA